LSRACRASILSLGPAAAVAASSGSAKDFLGVPYERFGRADHLFDRDSLIDGGSIDVVHGHSPHHPRPIEVYRDKLLLYGCGNFIDDYEGIHGYEEFRAELVLMYFPALAVDTGHLAALRMSPLRIRKMRLHRAAPEEAKWLGATLSRVSGGFGTRVELTADAQLVLSD
jgi:poly-gamma-glutamate synthesis protein (capsule biosynthesis protein)